MLIAYLDEFGHVGPYIGPEHKKFNQHPVFGYAGFVVPASNAREVGAAFQANKKRLFKTEIAASATPSQWERKGSEYFTTGSIAKRPEQIRVFQSLITMLVKNQGTLFYYGDQKPVGTLKQTGMDSNTITKNALKEAINRLCTHAEREDQDILLIMDAITDKSRREIVAEMYAHIFSRSRDAEHPEMKRIVDAPLHIESSLNASIQFADWICALIGRFSHWQLVPSSPFAWAETHFAETLQQKFTYESKLFLSSGASIHHSELLRLGKAYPPTSVGEQARIPKDFYQKLRAGLPTSP